MHLAIFDPIGVARRPQERIDEWRKRHSPGAYTGSPSGIHSTSRCCVQECDGQGSAALEVGAAGLKPGSTFKLGTYQPRDERSFRTPSMEVVLTCLTRRSAYSPEQKATFKRTAGKQMLIFAEQSRNVYENKGNTDKMLGEEADICGSLERNPVTFWHQDGGKSCERGYRMTVASAFRLDHANGVWEIFGISRRRAEGNAKPRRARAQSVAGRTWVQGTCSKPAYNGISREVVENKGPQSDDHRDLSPGTNA